MKSRSNISLRMVIHLVSYWVEKRVKRTGNWFKIGGGLEKNSSHSLRRELKEQAIGFEEAFFMMKIFLEREAKHHFSCRLKISCTSAFNQTNEKQFNCFSCIQSNIVLKVNMQLELLQYQPHVALQCIINCREPNSP